MANETTYEGGVDMAQPMPERPYVSVTDTVDGGQALQFYNGASGLLVGVTRAWEDLTTIDDIKKLAADLAGALAASYPWMPHANACERVPNFDPDAIFEASPVEEGCTCLVAASLDALTRAREAGVLPGEEGRR